VSTSIVEGDDSVRRRKWDEFAKEGFVVRIHFTFQTHDVIRSRERKSALWISIRADRNFRQRGEVWLGHVTVEKELYATRLAWCRDNGRGGTERIKFHEGVNLRIPMSRHAVKWRQEKEADLSGSPRRATPLSALGSTCSQGKAVVAIQSVPAVSTIS